VRWADIVSIDEVKLAVAAINRWAHGIATPAEAAEVIGARVTREISPVAWGDTVQSAHIEAWREQVASVARLRWERAARERLIEDEMRAAADRLEARAAERGVRLGRAARDVIEDRAIEWARMRRGGAL
jgi:hypothetical protein